MSRRGKISPEEKLKTVEGILRGEIGCREAGRRLGVAYESVRAWIKKYESEGASAFVPTERNRSYSAELKAAAVQDYESGGGSLLEVCKRYKIRSKYQLQSWLEMYNSGKDFKTRSGGSRMGKARKTTEEERVQIARECLERGKDYCRTALKYQVSYQQVYTWVKKFEEMGESGLEDRRGQQIRHQSPRTPEEELKKKIAQLEHELYMTRMERDLLKKVKELERGDRWGK